MVGADGGSEEGPAIAIPPVRCIPQGWFSNKAKRSPRLNRTRQRLTAGGDLRPGRSREPGRGPAGTGKHQGPSLPQADTSGRRLGGRADRTYAHGQPKGAERAHKGHPRQARGCASPTPAACDLVTCLPLTPPRRDHCPGVRAPPARSGPIRVGRLVTTDSAYPTLTSNQYPRSLSLADVQPHHRMPLARTTAGASSPPASRTRRITGRHMM